jgi:hypothetical protein
MINRLGKMCVAAMSLCMIAFIVTLKQQPVGRNVTPFGHIILIPLGKRRLYVKGTPDSCEERI